MSAIIKGYEVLIPMKIGETEQKKYKIENFKIDFWQLITKLNWHDRDDGLYNFHGPSDVWTIDEWKEITRQIDNEYYPNIKDVMEKNNFAGKNELSRADEKDIIYHVIARGQDIYKAVIADSNFATAYIDQTMKFREFLKKY